jgi:hypothetical protein
MSSTKRNKERLSTPDYYVTPVPAIKEFLHAFYATHNEVIARNHFIPFEERPLRILDPCAGGDATHEMSYPTAIQEYGFPQINRLFTIDIRQDSKAEFKGDFLTADIDKGYYDVIITNPPFNIALDVIKRSLDIVKYGGLVIMLLRLNFFGSQGRKEFFQKYMPVATYVHSKRMKFSDNTQGDSIEYMHAVWQKGGYPKFSKLCVI